MSKLTLKEAFISNFPIDITRKHARELDKFVNYYELRDKNPDAFNTAMLGLDQARFFEKDQLAVFDIFDIDKKEFALVIKSCPNVIQSRRISSDTYNIFTTWIVHNILKSKLPDKTKDLMAMQMFKLMIYKFFTSLTYRYWKHRVNEDIMRYTIDHLSAKYNIRKPETPTWKLVIEQRSGQISVKDSIHYKTLEHYSPDDKILYVITDAQTRMRTTLLNISTEFYKNWKEGKKVDTYGLVDEIDGEKVIKNIVASFDMMTRKVVNYTLNINTFIDYDLINLLSKMNASIRPDILRRFLMSFSDLAVQQYNAKRGKDEKSMKDYTLYTGYEALITNLIQKSYRSCIVKNVDMKSKLAVLEHISNVYKSSRISDEGLISVKESVEKLVRENLSTTREQTITAMKIGFILYIILLTFK